MRYEHVGENTCGELFHPGVKVSPYCMEDMGHDGDHDGFNLSWEREPQVDAETAELFLEGYRRIPNKTNVRLNDDGTVSMTVGTFAKSVTPFISTGSYPGDY